VLTLREGDELQVFSGGGGGYGDPLDRDPALVLDDVFGRKVSLTAAREEYGVVLATGLDHVDEAATAALRLQLHEARGPIRWTWDRGTELGRA
jgi:N-methylhydantoinase B